MAIKNRLKGIITVSSGDSFQPFHYGVGRYGTKFLTELRDNKRFFAVRCANCKKSYVPPRPLCGPCYKLMDDWIEVGPEGILVAFTILRFAFIDPETGAKKPVPYGYGFIRLDGADTQLQHFLALDPGRPPRIGMRVRPVFEEIRRGTLRDIRHFAPLPIVEGGGTAAPRSNGPRTSGETPGAAREIL